VLTRAIRIELARPGWVGAGFLVWSLSVMGTSDHQPIYSYYCSATATDLERWWKLKIIVDVESKMRKKTFINSGGDNVMPHNYVHSEKKTESEKVKVMEECEAVIVVFSLESEKSDYVINDLSIAMEMKKPITPILLIKMKMAQR